jgi:DNA polymerase I-like protein with 3'-5' exonuclease and polymerase domains
MSGIQEDGDRPANPRAEAAEIEQLEASIKEFVRQRAANEAATQNRPTLEIKKPSHSRSEAVRYYRDALKWDVLPLAAPGKGGKRPLIPGYTEWKRDQLTDDLLKKHFGPGKTSNIGLIVRSPHLIVDLDSKEDQGTSAREWLETKQQLKTVPRERTGGGYHLHFCCRDLPPFQKRDGSPYKKALAANVTPQVTAELFYEGLNVVLSPSVHQSGASYEWEVVGEVPEVTWTELQSWFGFQNPAGRPTDAKRQAASKEWLQQFKGDLTTLNIVELAKTLKNYGHLIAPDERKHSVRCPWHEDHGNKAEGWSAADTSSVIYEESDRNFPVFSCLHQRHGPKSLEHFLAWAESMTPGIVDAHCAQSRVFVPGIRNEDGRVRILLPDQGRPVGIFAAQIAGAIAPRHKWFVKDRVVVEPRMVSPTEDLTYFGVVPISAVEICTAVEQFVETGSLGRGGDGVFLPDTMAESQGRQLLSAPQFVNGLPRISRVLEYRQPIIHEGELILQSVGYDERFATFTRPDAPAVSEMSLEEAKDLISEAIEGFPWKSAQDLTHAIARLITPFCRGLMGWWARTPLWFFNANRPRAGKDYLNGIVQIVYSGYAFEDAALNREREEVRKRITTALMFGRRSMHFANCRDKLDQTALEQAITAPLWVDRVLGSNREVQLANEMEFSLSANVGVSYTPDFDARVRKIRLAYPDEDANARVFRRPDLHGWVRNHRAELLSAVFALVRNWYAAGRPACPTPFTSFPEWSRIVGGITYLAGFGDPCQPHEADGSSGDELTEAMRALFTLCYETHPEEWIEKKEIYEVVEEQQAENDILNFFGDFSEQSRRSDQTRFGKNLQHFAGRVLNGILLASRPSGQSGRTDRAQFRFSKPRSDLSDSGAQIHATFFGSKSTNNPEKKQLEGNLGDFGDSARAVTDEEDEAANPRVEVEQTAGDDQATEDRRSRRTRRSSVTDTIPPVIVTQRKSLEGIAEAVRKADMIAFDLETYGATLDPWQGEIRILSLAVPGAPPWLLDLQAIGYDLGSLTSVLEAKKLIGHNAKFDALWLRVKCGLNINLIYCTCTASRLLTAGTEEENGLAACLSTHLNVHLAKDQGCSDWGSMLLTDEQTAYCADDVRYLHELQSILDERLLEAGLGKVAELEMALLPVIVNIEAAGFAVDRSRLETIRGQAQSETQCAVAELHQTLGTSVNPASPSQLLSALKQRGVILKDTSEESLLQASDTTVIPALLRYRAAEKRLQLTQKLLDSIKTDGRIHGQFNPTGTATGRFSSKEPNMQNIERGEVRECFTAQQGKVLIVADYSQIELRLAAAIAPEPLMIESYNSGADLHVRTAGIILSKADEAVTPDERRLAKGINFGLLYGQRADGLVRYLKTSYGVTITKAESAKFISRFFGSYKGLRQWQQRAKRIAGNPATREIRTRFGRRRLLPKDKSWQRYTSVLNTPIQGGSNDGLKLALLELSRKLPAGARIVSTVHDEIIVECNASDADQVKVHVESEMKSAVGVLYPEVPIIVESRVCNNWAEK